MEKMVPLSQITGRECAWAGCDAGFLTGDGPPPPGWRNLLVWAGKVDSKRRAESIAKDADRDAVLCPAHFHALEQCLKRLEQTH